jgi:flagellar biosynthesis protein FliP
MASTIPPSPTKEQPSDVDSENRERELSTPPSDDIQPESNQGHELDVSPTTQEQEWVSGIKLFNIMTAITLVCFLMLLDTSIVVTVCVNALHFFFCC